ncbi:M13 family metallopeptidase [Mycoplasmopsis cynos]|uniref:Neutral endopeptidase n=1 Tax=Mycoplasmopsis cynos TaxID=171284 RepID=A0A449AJ58_9BACT|nr:M13 family metallopeptidase [Mycoplasmopsis cynos]TQC54534.1 M13 family peptidase [Mycoplasmopsis cynos]VEU65017.1 Neutral endopeptidase [Mycoplasmopsis cynos]
MQKNLKNDYYDAINHDWLKQAKIPEDRSQIGSFVEMDIKLEKLLKDTINGWYKYSKTLPNDPLIHEYVKYYSMLLDDQKRAELGWEPVKKYLNTLEKISSFKELFSKGRDFWIQYGALPLSIDIFEDFVDNTKRIIWISNPEISILPSKETYQNQEASKLIEAWKKMVNDLLLSYGKTQTQSEKLINQAIEFDQLYKDYLLSSVEWANYVALYNLKDISEIKKISHKFDIPKILNDFVKRDVSNASVINSNFFANFDKIFSDENFEGYKALMFIKNLLGTTSMLSEEIRIKANEFKKVLYSIDRSRSLEDYAFDMTNVFFGMPLGMYYANEFFGKKAKQDVEHMVANMIQIYKNRLHQNTWLSQTTIQKAITKLSSIEVMVGFPEVIRPYYTNFKVKTYEQGGTLFENASNFNKIIAEYKISLYLKDEDRRFWGMSPATINAYYNPNKNQIVFPAAILAWPFYQLDRVSSANYGGIGAVIAHEISHGFDNNGAQFDEKGSLNNWWTDSDRKEFELRTKKAIELFDGKETEFGKVNGKLTVSENIADLGGFECALEAAKLESDFDAKSFFESWATIWRSKYKEGAAKRLLETDVHSPTKIRANVVLSNSELFAQTYDIQPEDKMYLDPKKRVKIW